MKEKKLFYGWVIVAACCIVMATTMGIVSNCNSLFIKPICDDLGVSRQSVSTMLSLMSRGSMGASFFAGKIFNEDNIVRIMRVAILLMVIAYFANSFASNIYLLYGTYLVNGIAMCLVTILPMTFLINNWFSDKVGLALGLASMGSGFGGAIFNALAGQLITNMGWRNTYRILAIIMAALSIPCIFFLLKLRPEDMGLSPYRDPKLHENENVGAETVRSAPLTGYTYRVARKMPIYWIIAVIAILLGVCMNTMYASVSPHLQDKGYSLVFSANFMSIGMLAMAAGKILLGRVFDRFGVRIAFCWACLTLALALLGLWMCNLTPMLALVVLGIAFGCIFGAVVFPMSIPGIFGKKDYRAIMGPYSRMISLGGVFAPIFSGRMYDTFGSYDIAYIVCLVIMAAVIAVLWLKLPKKDQQF